MLLLATVLEMLLGLIFVWLVLTVLLHYRREPSAERLHLLFMLGSVFLAMMCGFVIEPVFVFLGYTAGAVLAFKLIEALLMIGVFWLYVFLGDFVKGLRSYAPISFVGMLIVVGMIASFPVEIVRQEVLFSEVRHPWVGLAIVVYWVSHFALGSYVFWRFSQFVEQRLPRVRALFVAAGLAVGILVYPASVLLPLISRRLLIVSDFVAFGLTLVAGVLFLLGAEMPARVKSFIEGRTRK